MKNISTNFARLNLAKETISAKEQQHITGGRRYVTNDPIKFQQKCMEVSGQSSNVHITMNNGTYCIEW